MNKALQKLGIALTILVLPLWLVAQSGSVDLQTYEDMPVEYSFTSNPVPPSMPIPPEHGQVSVTGNVNSGYELTYTPDEDYIGTDYFRLNIFYNFAPGILDFHVTVLPALVKANPDYASTVSGVPVSIAVVDNDFSSTGAKILAAAPAVNHGTVQLVNNEIVFTPYANFAGLAHFNYVVCNGAETCDKSFVNVTVIGTGTPEVDTLRIFTKKDQEQFILVPDTYTHISGPTNGYYDPAADVPIYHPADDYVGSDHLLFSHDGVTTYYDIRVLDLPTNTFAVEDRVFTTVGNELEFNVLDNDLFGSNANCLNYGTPEEGGTLTSLPYPQFPRGTVIYDPPPGFVGVDRFTYTSMPPLCGGEEETTTVYVFVSNFEPDAARFRMSTPKMTPIIIGYNIPTGVFSFEVAEQGDLGAAFFLPGMVDTIIYGQPIVGDNLLIYVPDETVSTGEDEFEITYCLLDPQSGCAVERSVKIDMTILDVGNGDPLCVGDCVWAGDTNFDGVVNMEDLLPIGLSIGDIGNPRMDATLDYWYGQFAEDWSSLLLGSQSSGANLKHIDADGDSIVTAIDTAAINLFYGRTHTMVPRELPFTTFDVILEGDIFISPGEEVSLKIHVGDSEYPAADVYGFVIPFLYNSDFIVPNSVSVNFESESWLSYDSPVLHMQHNDNAGKLDVGFTRTNGISASGFGEVGTLGFTVVEDIAGFRSDEPEIIIPLGGNSAVAMNSAGQSVAVNVAPFNLRLRINPEPEPLIDEDLSVYPNPTRDLLKVHLNGGHEFTDLVLYDLMGQRVQNWSGLRTNDAQLSLQGLPEGVYVLQVIGEEKSLSRKVQLVK